MDELYTQFKNLSSLPHEQQLVCVVDVLLVAYVIYRLLMLVQGTQAWRIFLGCLGFVVIYRLSAVLQLNTLYWLLDKAIYLGPAAFVILFFPELRAAIEGFLPQTVFLDKLASAKIEERAAARTVEELVAAVAELAADRVGALIVVERVAPLDEFVANGVRLDALVSAPLLESIFFEKNPLHDGAAILKGDHIVAAACRLPLSQSKTIDPHVHMRHRAAVGITEALDCLSIVVSEERGTISIAIDGDLRRLASHNELRSILNRELRNIEDGPVLDGPGRTHARRRRARLAE